MYNISDFGVPIVHIEPGPYSVEYGQDITLVCNISSNPSHYHVYWTRDLNGVKRTSYYGGNITFSPALKFMSRVTFQESGEYICHAQNENGVGKRNL